ncbi:hypothetical protein PR048_023523 [Dryococelus australis]|uniref:DUF4371 domain-containing protein n=1 Tax=Dryococelus australis TaxID=614101 RepID=A0ABQ9GUB5_9NEOP|nr:hypothetical protein PR048_023523 [Dryococelus australis]
MCVPSGSDVLDWCLTLGSRKGTRTPPGETVEAALPAASSIAKTSHKLRATNIYRSGHLPTPPPALETRSKAFTRHFHSRTYEDISWLCGCKNTMKLFCCLAYFSEKKNRHGCFRFIHIVCLKELKQFGKTRIEFAVSIQYRLSIDMHNEKVRKNRQIVSHLIRTTYFLAKLELAFRIFTGLSSDIQIDILFSLSDLFLHELNKEIEESSFVALILDETTNIAVKSQLSSVLRYVTSDGNVEERFLKWIDFSDNRTANGLYQRAIQILEDFKCVDKLVVQTYEGAAVKAEEHGGLQTKIIAVSDQTIFVHCSAHK